MHNRAHHDGAVQIETDKTLQPATNTADYKIEEIVVGGGDLILETTRKNGKKMGYLVGSPVLGSSSRVFHTMLGRASSFKEAIDVRGAAILGSQPVVMQVEDDSETLGRVLKVLHHRYELSKEDISFEDFVRIAEICLRYELRVPLQALADGLKESLDLENIVTVESGYEDCVLIANVFGYERLFTVATKEAMMWSTKGSCFEQNQGLSTCTPCSITDEISPARDPQSRHPLTRG